MSRQMIAEVKSSAPESAQIAGFVHNKRVMKNLVFIEVRDLSGVMQVVLEESNPHFALAGDLTLESVILVSGKLQSKPIKGSDLKDCEILCVDLEVLSAAEPMLPIPVFEKGDNDPDIDLRFDWRFLDLRRAKNAMVLKVWAELENGVRQYLSANNYLTIYTPCLMSTASETGADVFEVKYFDRKAYLAQSPQFYKQMAMAAGLEKVFAVGTIFRAEKSFTTRHVTEFTGWDFEISYVTDLAEIMSEEEQMLVSGFQNIKSLAVDIPTVPFPKITLASAKELLVKEGIKGEKADDLSPEEERMLSEIIKRDYNHDFVFVTDWPITARPFYHMRHDGDLTHSFDLLYRGLEITTGAIREHRYEILKEQALSKDMNLDELSDYLNFFKFGCPPHGGAGIGPARIIMKILGLNSIKEAIFLPRDVKRLNP